MCWGGRQTWVWTSAEALTNYITWDKFLHLHTGDNNVYLTEEVTQPNCDYQTGSNIITIITTIKSSGSYLGWPIKECQKIPSLFSLFMAKLLFLSRNRLNLQIKLSVNLPGYLLPRLDISSLNPASWTQKAELTGESGGLVKQVFGRASRPRGEAKELIPPHLDHRLMVRCSESHSTSSGFKYHRELCGKDTQRHENEKIEM